MKIDQFSYFIINLCDFVLFFILNELIDSTNWSCIKIMKDMHLKRNEAHRHSMAKPAKAY